MSEKANEFEKGAYTPSVTAREEFRFVDYCNKDTPFAADPWVIRAENGGFYYCFSGRGGICVSYSEHADQIASSAKNATLVWKPPMGTAYSCEIWAPELHRIQGEWYIYFAADDGNNENHRMYALKCDGGCPTDSFSFVGQITDESNKWAIDGTVLQINSELYWIWSGWEGDENVAQNLYIAHMSTPTSIDSARVRISCPTLAWERKGGRPYINEGPSAVIRNGKVYVAYSASGSWCDDYCIAVLALEGKDPLCADNWRKADMPLLQKNDGSYGPGHASFAWLDDGRLWAFYHANEISGSSWGGRSFRMEPLDDDFDAPEGRKVCDPHAVLQVPRKERH